MSPNRFSSLGSESRTLVSEFRAHLPISKGGKRKRADDKRVGVCKPKTPSLL